VLGDQNPYSLKRHASNRVKPYLLFPWAAELVRHANILDLMGAVIGPDILVFHTTVWLKPPRSENYVPWHQDATYFGLAPFKHITAWVALTPSRPESGCVRVIPGSHHKGQLAHFDDHNDALTMLSRGQKLAGGIREEDAVDLVLEPGGVSLHRRLTVHSSGANRSDDWRIGIGIRLHSDPRVSYQADPAVRDSGAGHRPLQPFRPRGDAPGRTR
jgi:ectoine hydroxylase-related dioxygenase (phytanoyl-CoA dioxygenase family)